MKRGQTLLSRHQAQIRTMVRFGIVGVLATACYVAASFLLLNAGMTPQIANLLAFIVSAVTSYLGHYFFTYRSADAHLHVGARFVAMTAGLMVLSSAIHQSALLMGIAPRGAAFAVALTYPPLSYACNHLWVYARSTSRGIN